jgi:hypothetical protein
LTLTIGISHSLHVKWFNELNLIHETSKWVCPAIANCLKILCLMNIQVNEWKSGSFSSFSFSCGMHKRFEDNRCCL